VALPTEAAASLDRALLLVPSIADELGRDEVLRDVVEKRAKVGKLAALETARSVRNEYMRAAAIGGVAVASGEAGSIAEALRLVRAIDNKSLRRLQIREVAWQLRSLALARGEDGVIVAALKEVEALEEEEPPPSFFTGVHAASEFGPPLGIIVTAQARADKISEALQVARSIKDKMSRTEVIAAVAVEVAIAGKIRHSLEIVQSIEDHSERRLVLDRLLEPKSLSPLMMMPSIDERPGKVEELGEAATIATALPDDEQRSMAVGIIARAHAAAREIDEALALMPLINHQKARFLALVAIAKAQARAGLSAQSIASFDQALKIAQTFLPRDRYLRELAIAQAKAGQIAEALRVVQSIEGTMSTAGYTSTVNGRNVDHYRRWALYEIAYAQAKAGLLAEALQTARSIELPGEILGSGLGVVAEGLAESGHTDEALSAAEAMDPNRRAHVLARIAKSLAAAGRLAEALQIGRNIGLPKDRADALVSIAAAQARAGLMGEASATTLQALQATQSLAYKQQIVEVLVAAAEALPN
jgi:tetratricopeptide (TPR) repeat protein